jgi:lysophospholipid acyltransferase (LPLAT)-like uncharacterized protein
VCVLNADHVERIRAARRPLVMITWHGRMIVPTWFVRRWKVVAMISRHRDGEMVARLVERLGFDTVRGSSTRGGAAATLEMLDCVRAGQPAAMICDGPRGPIYRMKPGAPYMAMTTGATVVPATFSAERAWIFRSWDRFMVPKPFARVFMLWGEAITPPANPTELENFTQQLEDALNALTAEADKLAHRA